MHCIQYSHCVHFINGRNIHCSHCITHTCITLPSIPLHIIPLHAITYHHIPGNFLDTIYIPYIYIHTINILHIAFVPYIPYTYLQYVHTIQETQREWNRTHCVALHAHRQESCFRSSGVLQEACEAETPLSHMANNLGLLLERAARTHARLMRAFPHCKRQCESIYLDQLTSENSIPLIHPPHLLELVGV